MRKLPAEGGRNDGIQRRDRLASDRVRRGARKLGPYVVVAAVLLALVISMVVFSLLSRAGREGACPELAALVVLLVGT